MNRMGSSLQDRGFRFVVCPYCHRQTGMARRRCRCIFWCGSARLSDRKIEEAHSFEAAQAAGFHMDFYFSEDQAFKIDDGESVFFWVTEEGKVAVDWIGGPGILPQSRRRIPFSAGRKWDSGLLRRIKWKKGQW